MNTASMESWRRSWREGLAPVLPLNGLQALEQALRTGSESLCQCFTALPDWRGIGPDDPACALECADKHRPPLKACALGYCLWQALDLPTVAAVETAFLTLCRDVDAVRHLEPGCPKTGHFIGWFDGLPMAMMRQELLPEVVRAIAQRTAESIGGTP